MTSRLKTANRKHLQRLTCLFILCGWAWTIAAQEIQISPPLSSRIASYDIDVELDPVKKMLKGKEVLYWKNTSPDVIRELHFHLYLNAFKNTSSTFYRESGGRNTVLNVDLDQENIWGWIDMDAIVDGDGNDLTPSLRFIHPDDDNEKDQTVVVVDLAKGLQPGKSIELNIDFTAKLPRIRARTGYNRDFYHLAQWFPKIGVYEAPGVRYAEKGQWNCHQYHSNSEYYADFGVYNVNITVPKDYKVGASGSLQYIKNKGEKSTHTYRAEDVIDFAWSTSPHFVEHLGKWRRDLDIRVLTYPEHNGLAQRHIVSAQQSLEYLDKYVGPYPYKTLTIVCPPVHGSRAGGMEYPTLITTIGFAGMPTWVPMVETLTTHEFIHQYFQSMVATNEFEESWLDEGVTSYFENRIMDHYYGEKTSTFEFMGFHIGDGEQSRQGYVGLPNPKIAENFRPTWKFKHGSYHLITYNKTASWLKTLEGLVGWDTMNEIMRTYFMRWRFKHPCANDFIAIVNEVVTKNHGDRFGENMNWYFDQVLYGSDVCDYKVAAIRNRSTQEPWGIFTDKTDWGYPDEEADKDSTIYNAKVILHRLGEVKLPVDVKVDFDDGSSIIEQWDGQERSFEFNYRGTRKVVSAKVDPENKIDIDLNFNNNSYTVEPQTTALEKYAAKFMLLIQNIMQTMSFFI